MNDTPIYNKVRLMATSLLTAAALTACTSDSLFTSDDAADSNTPVTITASLGTYGNSITATSRTAPTAAELAQIAAPGEFTATSEIKLNTDADCIFSGSIYFYDYNNTANDAAYTNPPNITCHGFPITGTINNLKVMGDKDGSYFERNEFRLSDFANTDESDKRAYITISGGTGLGITGDNVFASTTRTSTATSTGYEFKLKHLVSKLTVHLVDKSSKGVASDKIATTTLTDDIDRSTKEVADFKITTTPTEGELKTDLTHIIAGTGTVDVYLTPIINEEKGITASDGYYNALIYASNGTGDYVGENSSPAPPTNYTDEAITLKLAEATATDKPAGTYTLKLNEITLKGLKTGDTRITEGNANGEGKWLYTRPGEHICLTLTVDQNQLISGSATIISDWTTAEASANVGNESTDGAQVKE